jgi:thymidylate synthase (FAD)
MHKVVPEVFIVAETKVDEEALGQYLTSIGASGWESDAPSDVEEIVEVMSRGCYQSFGTDINPNLTRVREGNEPHLTNVIASGHGSVLEHAYISFMFRNVSRVFTHELVRHRVGVAISQESLRFVRLEDLGMWIPSCFSSDAFATSIFEEAFRNAEAAYGKLLFVAAQIEGVDSFDKLSFAKKKIYTSAARRVAPIGLATNIGWTCNVRTLRHVINNRTAPGAEEEIRIVFNTVATLAQERWPNLFGDLEPIAEDGAIHYKDEVRP